MKKFLVSFHGSCGVGGLTFLDEEEIEAESEEDLGNLQAEAFWKAQEFYQLEGWYEVEEIIDPFDITEEDTDG
jgi:hypothetical protein